MRGIITDINKQKAVMLCSNGSFAEVANKNYRVGQQVTIKSNTAVKFCAMAACFLLLFISGISGYNLYFTPVSYVYVDINPSLRLDINRFDRVISITPLNSDAENLVASYQVHNSNTVQCIQNIISDCADSGYLTEENNDISIGLMTQHKNLSEQIKRISEKYNNGSYIAKVSELTPEENAEAMELHISSDKLKAVESYTDMFGGTVPDNAKKLKDKSNDEIYQEIDSSKSELKPSAENNAKPKKTENKKTDVSVASPKNNKNDDKQQNNGNAENKEKPEKPKDNFGNKGHDNDDNINNDDSTDDNYDDDKKSKSENQPNNDNSDNLGTKEKPDKKPQKND